MYLNMYKNLSFILLLSAIYSVTSKSYKPIVFMHGILGSPDEMINIQDWTNKAHPGTKFYPVNAFDGLSSLNPMWEQVENIRQQFINITKSHPEGVHLMCYSQGGLICRGLLSTVQHNVDTFIALSSPLAGQYGDTWYLKHFFPHFLKETIYELFYTKKGQRWSVANYWNDPHHQKYYKEYSEFLAPLNNDTVSPNITEYKKNFLRLKQVVFIGGPDDGVITPWQSSHFGFYNSTEGVMDMTQQPYFKMDSFGLQTLYNAKRIKTYVIPGVSHLFWHANQTVFQNAILPWLT